MRDSGQYRTAREGGGGLCSGSSRRATVADSKNKTAAAADDVPLQPPSTDGERLTCFAYAYVVK